MSFALGRLQHRMKRGAPCVIRKKAGSTVMNMANWQQQRQQRKDSDMIVGIGEAMSIHLTIRLDAYQDCHHRAKANAASRVARVAW